MNKSSNTLEQCQPMCLIQKVLNGKWKILILWYIAEYQIRRFGELQRHLGDITQSTLSKQLRELEGDGLITRYVYQQIPPKVEYSLSDKGITLVPILKQMRSWGEAFLL